MGPSQSCRPARSVQDVSWRLSQRLCLLKGCGQTFRPLFPLSRYCSSACRGAARRWRRQTANHRYRGSEQGKCRRRAQSCRYRQRLRQQRATDLSCQGADEGYPHLPTGQESCCQRPGCYEGFSKTARSPLQKFCSAACRQALRRVIVRERRWRRRLHGDRRSSWRGDDSW